MKLVLFKVFPSEVLIGTIKKCIPFGIEGNCLEKYKAIVSLGFTDVIIPAKYLHEPKK